MSTMYNQDMGVGVIGAGKFGLALCNLLAEKHPVKLYSRRQEDAVSFASNRRIRDVSLHNNVSLETDLENLCHTCEVLIPAIPSDNYPELVKAIQHTVNPGHFVIHATKGFIQSDANPDTKSHRPLTVSEYFEQFTTIRRIGMLAGPNLSHEIHQGLPAGAVIGSRFDEVITIGKELFSSDRFQVFGSNDLVAIELAGILKNYIAIGAGITEGLALGSNARSLYITRALAEIIYIANRLGVTSTSFLGLAGVGDLMTTCQSPLSRNFTVGYRIAKGETIESIINDSIETVEGLKTLKLIHNEWRYTSRIPIAQVLYEILFDDKDPKSLVEVFMRATGENDVEFAL
ncbi:MAG: NAD(P)H-dependent glycerol-3-phosphate dehydrogenase [Chitinophagales bacterium]